jgi:hypothetical protein
LVVEAMVKREFGPQLAAFERRAEVVANVNASSWRPCNFEILEAWRRATSDRPA